MRKKPSHLKTHAADRTVSKRRQAGRRRTKKNEHYRARQSRVGQARHVLAMEAS